MPQLTDPNFRRSVVLVIHHDAESTFGLVLNREVELTVSELCESLEFDWNGAQDAEVHWGGPVESHTGWLLFQDELDTDVTDEHVSHLGGALRFAGSMDVFRQLAERPPRDLRIFLGYAGWGGGQAARYCCASCCCSCRRRRRRCCCRRCRCRSCSRRAALAGGGLRRAGAGDVGSRAARDGHRPAAPDRDGGGALTCERESVTSDPPTRCAARAAT